MVFTMQHSIYTCENNDNTKFKWFLKDILCSCGFSEACDNHTFPIKMVSKRSTTKVKRYFFFTTNWLFSVSDSSSGCNYRIFKNKFCFEQYLVSLPLKQRKLFIHIRQKIVYERRLCSLCKTEIGDEFYYVLVCRELQNIRKQYLRRHFYVQPNMLKFF